MDTQTQTLTMNKLDELFRDVKEYRSSEKFKNYMEFCARFRLLGAYNALLVATQRPGVVYALTVQQWKKYNMRPTANACPLVILMPFGPVDFVFDASDVEHIPNTPMLKYQEELDNLIKPFSVEGKVIADEVRTLLGNLRLWGINYDPNLLSGSTFAAEIRMEDGEEMGTLKVRGRDFGIMIPYHYRISVNYQADDAEQFAALCHELGHYFCRHILPPTRDWWELRDIRPEQQEFEAESVAWLVCQRHGVQCKSSAAYLAGYMNKSQKVPAVSIGTIMSAVDQIEHMFKAVTVSSTPLYKHDDEFYFRLTGKRRNKAAKR